LVSANALTSIKTVAIYVKLLLPWVTACGQINRNQLSGQLSLAIPQWVGAVNWSSGISRLQKHMHLAECERNVNHASDATREGIYFYDLH